MAGKRRRLGRLAMRVRRTLRKSVVFVFDTLFASRLRRPDESVVGVVRLDALGDYLLWQECARSLRDLYPKDHYRLFLVANRQWAPLVEDLAVFDDVIAVDLKRFDWHLGYRARVIRRIRRERAAEFINPTFSRSLLESDAIARTCGARRVKGISGDFANRSRLEAALGDGVYTDLYSTTGWPVHELLRNTEFMRALGHRKLSPALARFGSEQTRRLPSSLDGRDFCVVVPGAGGASRRWPVQRFEETVRYVRERTGWDVVICGAPSERQLAQKLSGSGFIDLVGRTDLLGLVSVISCAKLVVTNDTGSAHIGAAVGVPTVCIAGGGQFNRFVPYADAEGPPTRLEVCYDHMPCFGCGWKCVFDITPDQVFPCVDRVEVEAVRAVIDRVLEVSQVDNHGAERAEDTRFPASPAGSVHA